MKALKHLLKTTKLVTGEIESKYFTLKYSQIFKQKPLFFLTKDCVNQRKSLFYLKVLLGKNFHHLDESTGNYYGKTCQVETKPVNK